MLVNILFPINAGAFTYSVPEDLESEVKIGSRVLAPFINRHKVGIVASLAKSGLTDKKIVIKPIKTVLDDHPLIPENLLKLINWTGQYYMSTPGLALKNAVPSGVLEGRKSGKSRITYDQNIEPTAPLSLTPEQKKALTEINAVRSGAFLLHGVTGSGKTEVYLRAIEALPDGKTAIVLVPEIALTSQMIDKFNCRFNGRVAFLHSGMSSGEKISHWRKIRNAEVGVALGVRSAVFAPFTNIGLIVVDEEQETSYKQFEGLRYSARDIALVRAKLEDAKIILGSATPSLEARYNAEKGKLRYLQLKHRIEQKPMPEVEIIDMTREDTKLSSVSKKLSAVLQNNVSDGQQSLIMLNRRGYSPFLMCVDCGYTYKCPACSITLTYHKDSQTLKCHYCGSYLEPQTSCPKCRGTRTKYLGTGIQRVEEELSGSIKGISLIRMDRDTTRKKLSHYRMVKDMEKKKANVLLGTQMVAKGLDFPDVTVSAIISADVALNLPDFRSGERAFQLFTQLAGRSGRGRLPGKVYIQSYSNDHYVFDYVQKHDYEGFYKKELALRKDLSYPPFSRLIRIVFSFKTRNDANKTIKSVSENIRALKTPGVVILGPAPAPVEKIRNMWRWHLILKGKKSNLMRQAALLILEQVSHMKNVRIEVDVDPINLL